MIDEEELEQLYEAALAFEKSGDFDKAADMYRQMLECDEQDHAGAAVRLAAMGRGPTPSGAPKAYVATLFDQHAEVFDLILVDELGYDVPQQLRNHLEDVSGERIFAHLLDLGCGTGLCAEALEGKALRKTGVDLAENMIAVAHEKGDYDHLMIGDIEKFLSQSGETKWDLITAADVLPYMGDIEGFFTLVSAHLEEGGIFAFSSEILTPEQFGGAPYKVGSSKRFAHQTHYIQQVLSQAALTVLQVHDIIVRQEQGEDVTGQLFFSSKAGEGDEK